MKVKLSLVLIAFMLLISSEGTSQATNKKAPKSFKVVGYYLLNSLLRDTVQNDSNYTFLDRVTHVNVAFINPDTSGNFAKDLAIEAFIKRAHNKNVKVLPSIAGGGPHTIIRHYYAMIKGKC